MEFAALERLCMQSSLKHLGWTQETKDYSLLDMQYVVC